MQSILFIVGDALIASFQENLLNDGKNIKAYKTGLISSSEKNARTHKMQRQTAWRLQVLPIVRNKQFRKKCCRAFLKVFIKLFSFNPLLAFFLLPNMVMCPDSSGS